MARFRYGLAACVAVGLCLASTAIAATTDGPARYCPNATATVTASFDDRQMLILISVHDSVPVFQTTALPSVIGRSAAACEPPVYRRSRAMRPFGAAIRPTSVAGWRSGRVRRLAG